MTGGSVMQHDEGGSGSGTRRRRSGWALKLATALATPLLLGACSQAAPASAIMDSSKVGSIVVGRSTRTEVFSTLGQPSRTERSALGEAWIYEARTGDPGSGRTLMSGASAASGVVGAFVPFVGLIGSGIGLAGVAMDGTRAEPQVVSLTVAFRDDSVVRDCAYASTAAPAGVPGSAAGVAKLVDCQRPAPGGPRGL